MGVGFLAMVIFQIVGAVVIGRFQRTGEALIAFGATLLSGLVLYFVFVTLFLLRDLDRANLPVIMIAAAMVVLVVVCDTLLVKDGLRIRRIRRASNVNAELSLS